MARHTAHTQKPTLQLRGTHPQKWCQKMDQVDHEALFCACTDLNVACYCVYYRSGNERLREGSPKSILHLSCGRIHGTPALHNRQESSILPALGTDIPSKGVKCLWDSCSGPSTRKVALHQLVGRSSSTSSLADYAKMLVKNASNQANFPWNEIKPLRRDEGYAPELNFPDIPTCIFTRAV
jgi:hypothetical protein